MFLKKHDVHIVFGDYILYNQKWRYAGFKLKGKTTMVLAYFICLRQAYYLPPVFDYVSPPL